MGNCLVKLHLVIRHCELVKDIIRKLVRKQQRNYRDEELIRRPQSEINKVGFVFLVVL